MQDLVNLYWTQFRKFPRSLVMWGPRGWRTLHCWGLLDRKPVNGLAPNLYSIGGFEFLFLFFTRQYVCVALEKDMVVVSRAPGTGETEAELAP